MIYVNSIKFLDKVFEESISGAVFKNNEKRELTRDDLLKIESILVADREINGIGIPWGSDADAFNTIFPQVFFNTNKSENGQWVADMQMFSHIQALFIYLPTDDLSYLKGFTSIKQLYITDCSCSDWSFIEDMVKLEHLYINRCNFSNLAPLSTLCKKQEKAHQEAKQKREKDLLKFPLLTNLCMENCGITDISPLAHCRHIFDLNLSHNNISNLKPLAKLDCLYWLTLRYNQIEDIRPLSNMRGLYYLNLRHNNISDITILSSFETYYIGRSIPEI
jgi:internalin A